MMKIKKYLNVMDNNSEFLKPQIAYTEMKTKCLITDVEKRLDRKQKDFWIIRTLLGETRKSYLAFSTDYALTSRASFLLMNYEQLINQTVLLTIKNRNKDDSEKVIDLELKK